MELHDQETLDAVVKALDPATTAPPAPEMRASYARLRARLWALEVEQEGNPAPKRALGRRFVHRGGRGATSAGGAGRAWWYAAGVIGASILGIVVGRSVLTHSGNRWSSGSAIATTSYVTRNGERAEIRLPDGSTAMLNVASRLEVPTDFASGNRTLKLTGEALFTVAHLTGAPFTVTVGTTTARVLGTSFVARQYSGDTAAVVAVRDGRVAVQSTILTAQQQGVVGRNGVVRRGVASPGEFSFATGVLTLDRVPLQEAIVELDRWYDADIRVADAALTQARLRATLPAGSLTDLASMLEITLGARVVREGRVLTLYVR